VSKRSNWKQRRVAFIVSDAHHTITPVNITMPVRTKDHSDTYDVYEGPINAVWETMVRPRLLAQKRPESPFREIASAPDLVGVLIADDTVASDGYISWLVQSPIDEEEAGADYIKQKESL
jgi:hypothetical protein